MDHRLSATELQDTRAPELLSITWSFAALAVILGAVRLYTRLQILRQKGWDDVLTFFALLLVLIYSGLVSASTKFGLGKHIQILDINEISQAVKLAHIASPFVATTTSLPNLSIAITWCRIFTPSQREHLFLHAVPTLQALILLSACMLSIFQCVPTRALWDPNIQGKCLPPSTIVDFWFFNAAFSAFTHFFLAIFPTVAIWKIQIKYSTKIVVCLLMGLTTLAAVCPIVLCANLNSIFVTPDFTYKFVDLCIWATLEADIMIIASCVPTIRPFVASFRKQRRTSQGGTALLARGSNRLSANVGQRISPQAAASGTINPDSPSEKREKYKTNGTESTHATQTERPISTGSTEATETASEKASEMV